MPTNRGASALGRGRRQKRQWDVADDRRAIRPELKWDVADDRRASRPELKWGATVNGTEVTDNNLMLVRDSQDLYLARSQRPKRP